MRIVDLLNKDSILLNGVPKSKTEAIDMLVDLQMKSGNISDREIYKQGILAREEKGSTAVGEGIAIPHAKSSAVKAPSLAAMTVPGGVDYEALDDEPSDVLFMIAAPDTEADVHLEVLSRLMTLLMDEDFRAKLLSAKDTDEFLSVIDTAEKAKYPDEPSAKEVPENTDRIKVLSTKVSDGIKIPEELIGRIEKGDAPVYHHEGGAASSSSSMANESFGRKIYKHLMNGVSNMLPFTVAGGIFIALAFLIDTLMGVQPGDNFGTVTPVAAFFKTIGGYAFNFMIPVLAGYIGKSIADRPGFLVGLVGGYLATTGSTFVKIGGDVPSGFLGALFAGFVGGFIMLGLEKLCDKMPRALNGIKPVLIYPLAGLGIIAVVMCAINPFMGIINTAIADFLNHMGAESKIFLGVILGAMMSIDMGGPFNKAAYVFGTAAIATGGYDIMAAVMIGGMVPPIAIALSTTFFKSRWTEEERKNGPVNYIMGLSFITEGAIPYAAADPIRVIPACMVGAGIAGGLSMAFNCTLMAPHGGIFVFAVVGNWPMYLVSLAVGAVVSMLLLALLKKKKTVKEPETK